MINFISKNNYPKDEGFILSCEGDIFTTKLDKKRLIICRKDKDTYIHEVDFVKDFVPRFPPDTISANLNLYYGAGFEPSVTKPILDVTEEYRLTSLFEAGIMVDAAKEEPLILHYRYVNNEFLLSLYNLATKVNNIIYHKQVENIDDINLCHFLVGSFVNKLSRDVYISCPLLGIYNSFLIHDAVHTSEYYLHTPAASLDDWCSSSQLIKVADFNGDGYSDLLCVARKSIMINKDKASFFKKADLLNNFPGSWGNSFTTEYQIGVGDFDGDGLFEFASFTDNAKPQIMFNNAVSGFNSRSESSDGSFRINYLDQWCGVGSSSATPQDLRIITADFDNDGKEDLLCLNTKSHNAYLMLSRNNAIKTTLSKVEVIVDNFIIGQNIKYEVSAYNSPLFCNATGIVEYKTKLSCTFNSHNKVRDFTKPVQPSANLPKLTLAADIKGQIHFGDNDQFQIINPNDELVNNQRVCASNKLSNYQAFPRMSFWKRDDVSYNDPSRAFSTVIKQEYIRDGLAYSRKDNEIVHGYGYRTHGGDCNEINFNHIRLYNQFTAEGVLRAYDQSGSLIRDINILSGIASLYLIEGNIAGNSVTKIVNGKVSFAFGGQVELETLYQKNVTNCKKEDISTTVLGVTNNLNNVETGKYASSLCVVGGQVEVLPKKKNSEYPDTNLKSEHNIDAIITRNDTEQLDGLIFEGSAFFPNSTAVNFTWVAQKATQITEVHSELQFSNNTYLKAFVKEFPYEPRNELRVQFIKDGELLYEPAGDNLPYLAFDSIKSVQLAGFNEKNVLLTWSIFLKEDQQYYILVDYPNTKSDLLRIRSYNEQYRIAVPSSVAYGNLYFIAYKSAVDKLTITQYLAGIYDPISATELSVPAATLTNYDISIEGIDEGTTLVLTTTYSDKGVVIQKFNRRLEAITPEENIICLNSIDTQDTLHTNIDKAYQTLDLNYRHNTKVIYHDRAEQNRVANLNRKQNLQSALNHINDGLGQIEYLLSNPGPNTESNIRSSLGQLTCSSSLSYEYLASSISSWRKLLASDLTFEMHTAASIKEANIEAFLKRDKSKQVKCKNDLGAFYPIYREGNIVHLCPGYDDILSSFQECVNLMDQAPATSQLLSPEIPAVLPALLIERFKYYPSSVITELTKIVNGQNIGMQVGVCLGARGYGDPAQNNNFLAISILSGLLSISEPKEKVSISDCKAMVANSCSTVEDQQKSNLCLPYFIDTAASAYLITQSAYSNVDPKLNCQTGCNLGDDALNALLKGVGGYVVRDINIAGLFASSNQAKSASTEVLSYNTTSLANFDYVQNETDHRVITATAKSFYDDSKSLITFAYLGNSYIDIKTQYYNITNNAALSTEQHLGRFQNVRHIDMAAFNDSHVLIGYSVKHPSSSAYNILLEYLTPNTAVSGRIVNIGQSFNGIFAITTVPQNTTTMNTAAASEFMVTYASSSQKLVAKRYKVTAHSIKEHLRVEEVIPDIEAHSGSNAQDNSSANKDSLYVTIGSFLDNSFNVVWSYFNDLGIYLQRYNQTTGSLVGSRENIYGQNLGDLNIENASISYPQTIKSKYDESGKTILAWQNNDTVFFRMFSQTRQHSNYSNNTLNASTALNNTSYKTLNFTADGFGLQSVSILDAGSDRVSIALQNINNTIKKVIVDARSKAINYEGFLYDEDGKVIDKNQTLRSLIESLNSTSTKRKINTTQTKTKTQSRSIANEYNDVDEGSNASTSNSSVPSQADIKAITESIEQSKIIDKIIGSLKNIKINQGQAAKEGKCSSGSITNQTQTQSSSNSTQNPFDTDLLSGIDIEDAVQEAQRLLKNKPDLVANLQSVLAGKEMQESIKGLNIQPDAIYKLVDQISSIDDIKSYFKDSFNPFKELNFDSVEDFSIREQMQQLQEMNSTIYAALNDPDGEFAQNIAQADGNDDKIIELLTTQLKIFLQDIMKQTLGEIVDKLDPSSETTKTLILVTTVATAFIGAFGVYSVVVSEMLSKMTSFTGMFDRKFTGQDMDELFEVHERAFHEEANFRLSKEVSIALAFVLGIVVIMSLLEGVSISVNNNNDGDNQPQDTTKVPTWTKPPTTTLPPTLPPTPPSTKVPPGATTPEQVKRCLEATRHTEICSSLVYDISGQCWAPIGSESGGNPTIRFKNNKVDATLAIGKSIKYGKAWESIAAFSASYIFHNSKLFYGYKTVMPEIKVIAPAFTSAAGNSCTHEDSGGGKYRVASSFIENKSMRRLIDDTLEEEECNGRNSNGDCRGVLYNEFAQLDPDSVADYIFSQFLLGGGDFQETNIAVKEENNKRILFKLDLDISFQKGKFKGAEQGNRLKCDTEMADAIYNPKVKDLTWSKFKEVLVYDANLIFLSPKRCKWSIDNNGVVGFHSDTGAMQDSNRLTFGTVIDLQPTCRQNIISKIKGKEQLGGGSYDSNHPDDRYCKLLVDVMSGLDNRKNGLDCNKLKTDDFVKSQGVAQYFKSVLTNERTVCEPDIFADDLVDWLAGQCQGIKNLPE